MSGDWKHTEELMAKFRGNPRLEPIVHQMLVLLDSDLLGQLEIVATGRQVLLERIINHRYQYNNDGTIRLLDETVWSTDVAHQQWLFDENDNDTLTNYSNHFRGAIDDEVVDRPNTPHERRHRGAPITNRFDRRSLIQVKDESKRQLNFFQRGNTDPNTGNYPYDDLYGLVKAKLNWTGQHCNEHMMVHMLNFLMTKEPQVMGNLFPDRNAAAWTELAQSFDPTDPTTPDIEHVKDDFYGAVISSISSHTSY